MGVSLRCYNGTNAATESAAITAIALLSVDAATVDPGSHVVAKGANSYEKWLAVKVDSADGTTWSDFSVTCSGVLPTGVTIKVGVTSTAATPTNATSLVATTTLQAGRRYTFDTATYDTAGEKTAYLVVQEQVAATAASGAIPQQALTVNYVTG